MHDCLSVIEFSAGTGPPAPLSLGEVPAIQVRFAKQISQEHGEVVAVLWRAMPRALLSMLSTFQDDMSGRCDCQHEVPDPA